MPDRFPTALQPHRLGHLTLRNRINFGAHSPNMGIGQTLSERNFEYYRARARGGAGMICIEPIPAHPAAWNTRAQFLPVHEGMIPTFRKFTDMIHAEGAAVMQQVFHIGEHADTENSELPAMGPSENLSTKYNAASHAMTEAEIEETIAAFAASARMLRECGFDGVEFNGGYDSLIPAFWSARDNRRHDGWGGSFERRMRFSAKILGRTRAAVGPDFVIGLTLTGDDVTPGGMAIDERLEIAAWHDERGLMDYVAIKTGTYYDWARVMPSFMYEGMVGPEAAARYRATLKHAKVQAESRIRTIENAEKVLSCGQADMVSLVRAQIAEPELVNKARAGRPESVRSCISCNQLCVGRRFRDYWFSCLVNPSVGREGSLPSDGFPPAEAPRKLVVAGAGPAGLEVARVAAERGHEVTLIEAEREIGGQFRLAAAQPRRGEIAELLDGYYRTELARLGVELRLGERATPDTPGLAAADAVVWATGSAPAMTGRQRRLPALRMLPGVERPNVHSVNQILGGAAAPGGHVVVLDDVEGAMPAAGTVAFLGDRGIAVTVVTSSATPLQALVNSTADGPVRHMWAESGVRVMASSVLLEWTGEGAVVQNTVSGRNETVAADALVLATPNKPAAIPGLPRESAAETFEIGDCVAARTAAVAFYEGRKLGMAL